MTAWIRTSFSPHLTSIMAAAIALGALSACSGDDTARAAQGDARDVFSPALAEPPTATPSADEQGSPDKEEADKGEAPDPKAGEEPRVAEAPGQEAGEKALGEDKALGAAPVKARSGADSSMPFMDYIASNCLVDELEYTEYAVGWATWARKAGFKPKTGPSVTKGHQKKQPEGSEAASARAAALRKEWKENPRSHVIECTLKLERRDCEHCADKGATQTSYTAYLPKAIIDDPDKVRSLLILIPGGNGARTRYFLTPIPNKTIFDKMSGGLEVQRHADEFKAANPDVEVPIIVAINGGGWLLANGATEFQTHDIPRHMASTYMGTDDLRTIAIGADGISSGSRAMLRSYPVKPFAANTIGLTCMHCGGKRGGFLFDEDFLAFNQDNRIFKAWKEMADNGLLHIHFAIGNRDKYWICNREIHERFTKEGLFEDTPPQFKDCREGKQTPKTCDVSWDGFELYDGQGHHYGLLTDSWIPSLHWHFRALDKTVKAIDAGAVSKMSAYRDP